MNSKKAENFFLRRWRSRKTKNRIRRLMNRKKTLKCLFFISRVKIGSFVIQDQKRDFQMGTFEEIR